MSPPPASADVFAPEEYRSQLETLVSLLQVANAVPDMADPILLGQMVETLQESTASASLPGVPDLLRCWKAALHDFGRRGEPLSQDDLVRMSLWFTGLQEHLAGRLDRDGRHMLARLPEDIQWLPRLSSSFMHVIARRLDAAAEPMQTTETTLETTSEAISKSAPVHASSDVPDAFSIAADTAMLFATPAAVEIPARDISFEVDIAAISEFHNESSNQLRNEFLNEDIAPADGSDFDATEPSHVEDTTSVMSDASPVAMLTEADAPDTAFAMDAFSTKIRAPDTFDDAPPIFVADTANGTIWIGQEELDLTRQALVEQVLPLAQAWAEIPDPDVNTSLVEELLYQCQLIVNVMELIGTPALAHGMAVVRHGIEQRSPAVPPEILATWCSALLAAIEQPDRDAAELLVSVAPELAALDTAWATALGDEMARVVIGFDPALLAQRKSLATEDDIQLVPADDVLPNVLDGMYRELPGNAARLGSSVRELADTRSPTPIDEARRVAHTLKGDANTVGIRGLANITHALEDILIVLAKRPDLLNDDCAELLTAASDCVEEISDYLLQRGPAPNNLLGIYQHVLDTANALADGAEAPPAPMMSTETEQDETSQAVDTSMAGTVPADTLLADALAETPRAESAASDNALPATEIARATASDTMPSPAAEVTAADSGMVASGIQSLNVPSTLLDELQRLAGENLVTSRQIDQQIDGLGSIYRDQRQGVRYTNELMGRLDDLVSLRGAALQSTAQKAGADLDPLEIDQYNELHVISRQLLEAHADSGEFMRRIERLMNTLGDLRSEQEQLNRDLQRTIQRTRTVPFGQVSQRLQRIVRQTAKQVFKQVQLDIIGEEIPVDAELLERIVEPLAHLLRNAIDHGIETPEQRRALGKSDSGRIVLRVGLQGDAAMIELQDDGRGLDLVAIRQRAIATGLLTADQNADDRLLTRMILLPGFSTRSTATEVSGRGIGMDVVNQRIAALRGTLMITTETGRGTRVQLRLPVTQTLANVIIARGQRQVSAVVAASVERVVSFAAGECRYDNGQLRITIDDELLTAMPIETFYGESADISMWLDANGIGLYVRNPDGKASVVLVKAIDEVRSVVVKPISAYLPPIPAVRGVTQLGDGGLAPVIDLDVLLQSTSEQHFDTAQLSSSAPLAATRVVVADDSLSVRRALEQLMQDAGFEVETARDGFEALAAIHAKPTHALLVDLEMPRMNGLEVTRNLRNAVETRDLPVVMITSRATEKHQTMAEQAGVTRMLGKPFSEDSLVILVRDLIAERRNAEAATAVTS